MIQWQGSQNLVITQLVGQHAREQSPRERQLHRPRGSSIHHKVHLPFSLLCSSLEGIHPPLQSLLSQPIPSVVHSLGEEILPGISVDHLLWNLQRMSSSSLYPTRAITVVCIKLSISKMLQGNMQNFERSYDENAARNKKQVWKELRGNSHEALFSSSFFAFSIVYPQRMVGNEPNLDSFQHTYRWSDAENFSSVCLLVRE